MRLIILLLLSSLLFACSGDPIQRQPNIAIEAVTHVFSLRLLAETLDGEDRAALEEFLLRRGDPANLRVRIETHSLRGEKVLTSVRDLMHLRNIYPSQIRTLKRESASTSEDLTLVVESYRTLVRHCDAGKEPKTILNSFKRSANFGCANASALAQMVANPRDLVVGETLSATEGRKAVSTLDAYYAQPNAPLRESSPISGALSGGSGN
ncbi:CpaD family pilus assembly lipoprotein [Shewanella violacea]|uniref:Lipoprotein n=1 Tax=Shewanella violacea (strain JCM 10179 / CIP 106290 / LMG 19151 / DSS12) TaxID=637905 RepID=D4ZHC2_SHEVD|nr:CpaD family pilus assembly lipoprotein [Shewanella violacea]BAJ01071.1 hypothetical protein SVI_1100 [Shewanella violacea DSS12]